MQIDPNEFGMLVELLRGCCERQASVIEKCCALQAQTRQQCCASITRVLWVLVLVFVLLLAAAARLAMLRGG
jgi:hypothetical protein